MRTRRSRGPQDAREAAIGRVSVLRAAVQDPAASYSRRGSRKTDNVAAVLGVKWIPSSNVGGKREKLHGPRHAVACIKSMAKSLSIGNGNVRRPHPVVSRIRMISSEAPGIPHRPTLTFLVAFRGRQRTVNQRRICFKAEISRNAVRPT